ncbi:helix-turn-helix transcriptional regulator [Lysinibacillus sp. LZ02]|uniref:helix-turn-helix transcriptional regulator n=1 Tax=Lysinibacillus sp. LZ02 TaxID=3420668 RepID=UPI003D368986
MKNKRDFLINLRKTEGLLQKEVVEKLSSEYGVTITESYYGMIEQGVRTPSLNVALAISDLFKIAPSEIFLDSNTTFCCESEKQLA